jgi:hypothetical protein
MDIRRSAPRSRRARIEKAALLLDGDGLEEAGKLAARLLREREDTERQRRGIEDGLAIVADGAGVYIGSDKLRREITQPAVEARRTLPIEHPQDYDTPHGLEQARASIVCARAFICDVARLTRLRAATDLAERVFRFATGREARGLSFRSQIEVFDAVPCCAPMPEGFRTQRYPRMLRAVQATRTSPARN